MLPEQSNPVPFPFSVEPFNSTSSSTSSSSSTIMFLRSRVYTAAWTQSRWSSQVQHPVARPCVLVKWNRMNIPRGQCCSFDCARNCHRQLAPRRLMVACMVYNMVEFCENKSQHRRTRMSFRKVHRVTKEVIAFEQLDSILCKVKQQRGNRCTLCRISNATNYRCYSTQKPREKKKWNASRRRTKNLRSVGPTENGIKCGTPESGATVASAAPSRSE